MGEMTAHLARWVLPVSGPPIEYRAVVTANGRVEQVGGAAQVLAGFTASVQEHGEGAILPGLVNCHTHLEFSALESVIPPQERWEDWLAAA